MTVAESATIKLYSRDGLVYIPTILATVDGVLYDAAPVQVMDVSDRSGIAKVIERELTSGNKRVPRPNWDALPPWPLLEAAGVKLKARFHEGAALYAVMVRGGKYSHGWWTPDLPEGWLARGPYVEEVPVETISIGDLAQKAASRLADPPDAMVYRSAVRKPKHKGKGAR